MLNWFLGRTVPQLVNKLLTSSSERQRARALEQLRRTGETSNAADLLVALYRASVTPQDTAHQRSKHNQC